MASNLDFKVKNGLVVAQTATFISTVNATSTSSGAVQLLGGAGIAKDLWVGGNVNVQGTINASVTGVITSATNIANGTAGQIPYQSAVGVTTFVGPGTAGQLLVSRGTAGPVFQNTLTLAGTTAATSTQTGALVVTGGVGVGQNLYVNDNTVLGTNYNNTATGSKITFRGIVQTATVSAVIDNTTNVVMAFPMNNWQIVATDGNYVRPVIAKDTANNVSIGVSGSSFHSDVNIYSGPTGNINFYSGSPNYRTYIDQFGRTFITTTTQVHSPTTGALQVAGGVGISGNMFLGGVVTATNFFVNGFPVTTGTNVALWYNNSNLGNVNALNFGTGTNVTFQSSSGTVWVNTATLMQYAVNVAGGTPGQLIYQSTANSTAFAGPGTIGQLLVSGGTNAPTYISTGTEGGVLVSKPGEPQFVSTTTIGAILVSQGKTPVYISTGSQGSLLMSQPGVPAFVTTSNIYVNSAIYADDLTGGGAGSLPYQSAANTTVFLAGGTNGNNLRYFNNAPIWSTTGSFSGGTANGTAVASQSITVSNGGLGVSGNSFFASDLGVGGILGVQNTNASVVTSANNSFYTLGGGWIEKTLLVNAKTDSAGTNSGALQVVGGLGVWLNTYIGGDLNVGGTVSAANIFGSITTASNLASGVAGAIPYQSAPGITAFSAAGTTGQLLVSGGTGAPTWAATTTLYVNRANFADNVQGGTTGALVYQSNANTTAFVSLSGTPKSLLTAGASAPVYVTQVQAQSGTGSASAASGQSLVVTGGGLGVTGDSYFANGLGVGGNQTITGTLQVNSTNADTGTNTSNSLYTAGGAWIDKSLVVAGPTTFRDTVSFLGTATYVYSTNTVVTDAIVNLHAPPGSTPEVHAWALDDGQDVGYIMHYFDGTDKDAFLGLNNATTYLEWWENGTAIGNIYTGTNWGTFRTGAIKLAGGAPNTGNTSSGDLTVLGGAGFGGNVWIQGALNVQGGVNAVINGTITTATNLSAGSAGTLVYQSAPGLTAYLSTGSTGQFLQANFTGAPVWTSTTTMYVNRAFYADDLIGGGSGAIAYQSAPNVTSFLSTGTPGQLLSAAVGSPSWVNTNTLVVGYAVNDVGGAAGSIRYQSGASVSTFLAIGAAGTFMTSNGTAPVWSSTATALIGYARNVQGGAAGQFVYQSAANTTAFISTGSMYVGDASIADNLRGGVAGNIPIQTASGVTGFIATGTAGYVLTMGTNAASWQALTGLASGSATTATNLAGGTAGQVPYQTAAGLTSFYGPGTAGQLLQSNGASAPSYVSTSGIYVNSSRFADELTGGAAGSLVYQTGANDTSFLGLGTQGYFLTAGASAPQWSNTATALIGYAQNLAGGTSGQFVYQSAANTTAFISTGSMYVNSSRFADELTGGAAGSIPYQTGANDTSFLAIGTNGFVLTSNGTAPTWQALGGLSAGSATTATNLAGGTAGQVPYQTSAGSTSFFGPGTAGQLLQSNGTSAPSYVNTTSIYVGRAFYSDDLIGGGGGAIAYQSAPNVTSFLSTGTPGQVLLAAVGAPTWVNTASLYVGGAATADKVANALSAGTGLTGSSFDGSVARTWTLNTATLMQYAVNVAGGAAGSLVYQSAASTTALLGLGSAGQVLTAGATAPQWTSITGLTAGQATTATNLAGGTAGQLHYQVSPGISGFAGPGTAGQLLISAGTSAPVYTNTGSIGVGFVSNALTISTGLSGTVSTYNGSAAVTVSLNTATLMQSAVNLPGGAGGSIPYQSAANTTALLAAGTAGFVLQTNGAGAAPSWVAPGTVGVGSATTASQVNTVARTVSANHFITFVDTNNASATGETVYTTSSFTVNPSTGLVTISGPSGDGLPVLRVTGTAAPGSFNWAGSFMNSSLGSGRNTVILIGQAESAKNSGYIGYNHSGTSGSDNNFLTFGHYSSDNLLNIHGNGNVNIGTTTNQGYKLYVNGTTYFAGNTRWTGYAISGNGTFTKGTPTSGEIQFDNGTTDSPGVSFYYGNNLNFGIDTSTYGGVQQMRFVKHINETGGTALGGIDLSGNLVMIGEITAYYSDRRLKTDVKPIDNALEKVLSLNGILYKPNEVAGSYGFDTSKSVVGLFADEVEAVLPEATKPAPFDLGDDGTSKSGENYKTVQYEKVVPLLVEAIKEQQKQIAQLTEMVKLLTNK